MTKKIVLFSDGTGNSSAKAQKTNVWRLFQALDQGSDDQIALHDNGVGTSTNKYLAAFGGAFGWGLKRNVINLYEFVCRNYEPGDAIYGFGFSRGAFTIRALIGLIKSEGLVIFGSEEELSRNAAAAYRHYRAARFPSKSPIVLGLRWARDALLWAKDRLTRCRSYDEVAKETEKYKRRAIRIKFLGLWDTVEAYGIPIPELKRGIDRVLWPMMFGDLKLSPLVDRACHALSLDDERATFHPLLWDEVAEAQMVRRMEVPKGRITQVWFAGVHSNVGGGYPEDQLSLVSLEWIMSQAMANGLMLDRAVVKQVSAAKSPYGRLYDSRAGLSSYYRYSPRRVPVYEGIEDWPIIHGSVVLRMANGSDRYAPISLPRRFRVLGPEGKLLAMEDSEELQLDETKRRTASADLPNDQAAQTSTAEADLRRAMSQFKSPAQNVVSLVWDTVWWRRILYFVTVLLTAALALYPWLNGFFAKAARQSLAWIPLVGGMISGWIDEIPTIDKSSRGPVSEFVNAVNGFVPSYAQPWLNALREHPVEFVSIVIAIVLSFYASSILETKIRDRTWLAWHARNKTDYLERLRGNQPAWRADMARFGKPGLQSEGLSIPASFGLSLARKLRKNPILVKVYRAIFERVVPYGFALCVLALGILLTNRILFDAASAAGVFCRSIDARQLQRVEPNGEVRKEGFTTGETCWPTGIEVEEGHPYRITIEIADAWFDGTLGTDVDGYTSSTLWHFFETALKRWWSQNWFKPIARIGEFGNDEYVLDPVYPLKPSPAERRVLHADIKARTSGELFLYVNDAVLMLPFLSGVFYRDNRGSGSVTVTSREP